MPRLTAATLVKLRFPASVPYLIPALKLAATASVVGAVVGEISAGLRGGLGRLIIDYSQQYLTDPARLYCAVIAAGVLGILFVGLIDVLDRILMRGRPRETTTMPPARPAISVSGVDKAFNPGRKGEVTALTGIDLDVAQGELVSLIGPSGCGKSTLLRLVGDLETPTAGSVEVNGKTARQARLDHDYGMAFQQAGLFDWRTVAATSSCRWSCSAGLGRRRERSRELLELVAPGGSPATARGSSPAACSSASPSPGRSPSTGDPADGRAVRRPRRDHP